MCTHKKSHASLSLFLFRVFFFFFIFLNSGQLTVPVPWQPPLFVVCNTACAWSLKFTSHHRCLAVSRTGAAWIKVPLIVVLTPKTSNRSFSRLSAACTSSTVRVDTCWLQALRHFDSPPLTPPPGSEAAEWIRHRAPRLNGEFRTEHQAPPPIFTVPQAFGPLTSYYCVDW